MKINADKKAAIDQLATEQAREKQLATELPLEDQLDALWAIVEALIDGKEVPTNSLAALARRKAIKDEVR